MIDNRLEYQRMFEVEQSLWWYQILHGKVLSKIKAHWKLPASQVRILDAACGTGGLMSYLRERGFTKVTGFDYSQHAIDFSLSRGLDVEFGDLRHVDRFKPEERFDVICCNDALYFLSDAEIVVALKAFRMKLNPGGILIINIHAFEAFSGTHDLAVGSSRRFELKDFETYSQDAGLQVKYHTYWPFALSLPILLVRQWQKFRIRNNKINLEQNSSDVSYPGDVINGICRTLVKLEEKAFPTAPFGSSLFLVLGT